jgi:hypothetical protein
MTRTLARGSIVAVTGLVAVALSLGPAAAAGYATVDYTVNAQTTLATLQQTVVIPQGTFKGSINTSTGVLTGHLRLPPASTTVQLVGIGLADATFAMVPTKAVRGRLHNSTKGLAMTATATFNIHVISVKPLGLPVNLVGASCVTVTPIALKMSGPVSLTLPSTFTGTYTIPRFAHCQTATVALNLVLPGPGNAFTATLTPVITL